MLTQIMSEWLFRRGQEMVLGTLQYGQVPKHIAFIMDGNNRFARQHNLEILEAHNLGLETLSNSLDLCFRIGVRNVTVYVFNIDNLKRGRHEAAAVMNMVMTKLTQLALHGEVLTQFGVKMQFLGDMSLLHPDVAAAMKQCMELTGHNSRTLLNICVPYSSREEMASAIRTTVSDFSAPIIKSPLNRPVSESRIARTLYMQRLGTVTEEIEEEEPVKQDGHGAGGPATARFSLDSGSSVSSFNQLSHSEQETVSSTTDSVTQTLSPNPSSLTISFPDPESITADTITKHTYTADCPSPDILVRTSGASRLSDFMLWQSHEKTDFVVLDTLWPSFGFWDFCKIILEWQWQQREGEQQKRGGGSGE